MEFLRQSIKRLSTLVLVQEQEHIALVQKGVAVRKPRLQCLLQPALPGVNAAIGRQVHQCEGPRVEVRKVGIGGLKLKIRSRGKAAVQQMHEYVLCGLKGLVLPAGLHKQLLGEDALHQFPCLSGNFFQMSVRVHADEAAKLDPRADKERKPPGIRTARQLEKVRPPFRKGRASADKHTGFIGDLAAAHNVLKKLIGESLRQAVCRHMKGIVQHQQRTVQNLACAFRQLSEIILCEEFLQQRLSAAGLPLCVSHRPQPLSTCAFSTSISFFIVPTVSCFCKEKR